MGSYSGTCEIVEATDEMNNHHGMEGTSGLSIGEKERKLPILRLGARDSIEDDINQLFESFHLKNSSKGSSPMNQVGSSPLRKNALKKAITVGMPRSPGFGSSESVNLKPLRDLCLSKASEMAAMKRLSRSSASSTVSKAGRIKTLYDAKIVEAVKPGPSGNGIKGSFVEISLVPEESTSDHPVKTAPHQIQASAFKASKDNALPSPKLAARMKNVSVGTRENRNEPSGLGNQKSNVEARYRDKRSPSPTANSLNSSKESMENLKVLSMKTSNQRARSPSPSASSLNSSKESIENLKVSSIKTSNQRARSPSPSANSLNSSKESLENMKISNVKTSNQRARSPRLQDVKLQNGTKTPPSEKENISAIGRVAVKTLKGELAQQEDSMPEQASSTGLCNDHESLPRHHNNVTSPNKSLNKSPSSKARRKARLQTLSPSSSSGNGNRGNKLSRITPRVVKPVIRNKNIVKKLKQDLISVSKGSVAYVEAKEANLPTTGLVCEKCQCSLMSASKESKQETVLSHSIDSRTEVNSTNGNFVASKVLTGSNNGYNSGVVTGKAQKNTKLGDKGELSQSSKSSLGEYSSSTTSISTDDSNLSRSSCSNRPHMSKDLRWEAIRCVRRQHGPLVLKNFNLLKKLGCGDIGTVYLAELIGTNCSFAIKVMDNEFLLRRKKMSRAQTEREILKMLDHPFLPTLYSQFTSDNLSCLVMEYCPGGDLHVLRQKQPGKYFLEPAARFYVAEVLLALEYLHMLGVVYRDLKPENILVKEDGHIMLTDFDLSLRCSVNPTLLKSPSNAEPVRISGPCTESNCIQPFCVEPSCKVPCFSPRILPSAGKTVKAKADGAVQFGSLPQLIAEPTDARSNSFVGTHEYLAPEIIKGEGHGAAVDWWTFGVFLYELLYGRTPFKGPCNEDTLTNVILQSLKFPDTPLVSLQAQDLIRGLLVKDPENRLGTEKGAAEIKRHPFFQGLNWALIRCAVPPELPDGYEFGSKYPSPLETQSKYLDCKTTGEHLEFEIF